jgi:hypothetical protein
VCRALKVLCVASDDATLAALKRAAVAAEWELCPGATDMRGALDQIDAERPQYLVAFGPFERLVALAAERFPGMRIVTDRDTPGASAVATSLADVRGALRSEPRPGGPIGSAGKDRPATIGREDQPGRSAGKIGRQDQMSQPPHGRQP